MNLSGKESTGKGRRELARSEWLVMQTIWEAAENEPELSISEILPSIREKRKWHFSTAKTMANRLVEKGYLASRVRGKTSFYRPLVTREQATKKSLTTYLDEVLDGAFGPLVAYLAERTELTPPEIKQLEKLLERKPGKGREK